MLQLRWYGELDLETAKEAKDAALQMVQRNRPGHDSKQSSQSFAGGNPDMRHRCASSTHDVSRGKQVFKCFPVERYRAKGVPSEDASRGITKSVPGPCRGGKAAVQREPSAVSLTKRTSTDKPTTTSELTGQGLEANFCFTDVAGF